MKVLYKVAEYPYRAVLCEDTEKGYHVLYLYRFIGGGKESLVKTWDDFSSLDGKDFHELYSLYETLRKEIEKKAHIRRLGEVSKALQCGIDIHFNRQD